MLEELCRQLNQPRRSVTLSAALRSDSSNQKQNDDDNKYYSKDPNGTMAVAVTITSTKTMKAAEQSDDHNDEQYESERHDVSPTLARRPSRADRNISILTPLSAEKSIIHFRFGLSRSVEIRSQFSQKARDFP
jgi:hypothetical protein